MKPEVNDLGDRSAVEQTHTVTVQADISRSDDIRTKLYMYPRIRRNWVILGMISLIYTSIIVYIGEDFTLPAIAYAALTGVLAGAAVMLVCLLSPMLAIWLRAKSTSEALGPRTYELTDDGLRWHTSRGEGLRRWSAISSVRKTATSILIGSSPYAFFVVPLHAFASRLEFDNFYDKVHLLWNRSR